MPIKINRNLLFLVFFALFILASESYATTDGQKVFDAASKTVVVIKTTNTRNQPYKQGSGVVISKNTVATNCHVLQGGTSIIVKTSQGESNGTLDKGDIDKDICIIQTDTTALSIAEIRPSKSLKIGEAVFAIGSPAGLELTLSSGLISQLRGKNNPLIQTTAAISPGSSGGGLFDSKGKLIGITTFKIMGESLNFAAPASWIGDLPKISSDQLLSSSIESQSNNAMDLLKNNKLEEAISYCKKWVENDPEAFQAHYCLGLAYDKTGKYAAASESYKNVIRLQPDHKRAWFLLGGSFAQQGNYDQAIAAGKEGLKINPNDSDGWSLIARWYSVQDRYDEAISALTQGLSIKETDSNYRYLGFLYSVSEMFKNMRNSSYRVTYEPEVKAYRRALEIAPNNPENYRELLRVLERTGACDEHQSLYDKLKKLDRFAAIEYLGRLKKVYKPNCTLSE